MGDIVKFTENAYVANFLQSHKSRVNAYNMGEYLINEILNGTYIIRDIFPALHDILTLYNSINHIDRNNKQAIERSQSQLANKLLALETALPGPIPGLPYTVAPEKLDDAQFGLAIVLTNFKNPLVQSTDVNILLTRRVQMAVAMSAFNSLIYPQPTIQTTFVNNMPVRPFPEQVAVLDTAMRKFRAFVPDVIQFYKANTCMSVNDKADTLAIIKALRDLITSIPVYSSES